MGRFIRYVFAMVVIWISFWVIGQNTYATSEPLWQYDAIIKLSETPDDKYIGETHPCGGKEGVIVLKHETASNKACVFGTPESVQLARYVTRRGEFAYAVSFPNESHFFHVNGLCPRLGQCVYGHAGDTLLVQDGASYPRYHAVVKDFTKHLVRDPNDSSAYQFDHPGYLNYLKAANNRLITGSATVSSDGQWILIELSQYGLMRIDTVSGEARRIASRDSLPPAGGEITSFAISDDGRWAAAVGYGGGVYIYEVHDACGDVLTGFSSAVFLSGVTPCRFVLAFANQFFPSAEKLFAPTFSANARQLTVYRREGSPTKTTLTQKGLGFGDPHYIAFGDSFTSGEGELDDQFYRPGTNTASNRCHVSTRSYPYLLQAHWEVMATNLACSGARMEEVQKTSREYGELDVRPPSVVSLSIGGNDANFIGKLKSCLGLDRCEWAQDKYRKATALEIRSLFPRFVSLIHELKGSYGASRMFVVGYPNGINDQLEARCSTLVGVLLDAHERRYMRESTRYLNRVLKAAAKHAEVPFVDIESSYGDERLCDSKTTAMNGVRYGDDIAPIPFLERVKLIGAESFHPTPRGHYLASQAIRSGLNASWGSTACGGDCPFRESDLAIPPYWFEGEIPEAPPRLHFKQFLNGETYQGISSALYSFLKRTFAPSSMVTFELHSDVKELGRAVVSDDGSLQGELKLPLDIEGYHTVHALGTSYAGDPVDIYQTVYIAASAENNTGMKGDIADQGAFKQGNQVKRITNLDPSDTPNGEEGDAFEGESIKVAHSQGEPRVKGTLINTTAHDTPGENQEIKITPWYSWLGVGLIAGCALFLLWWILLKKPKL